MSPQEIIQNHPSAEPTLMDLAANFAKATAKFVLAGLPVVNQETFSKRAEICHACPHWDHKFPMGGRCKMCGCFKAKLYVETEKCPIGKWQ